MNDEQTQNTNNPTQDHIDKSVNRIVLMSLLIVGIIVIIACAAIVIWLMLFASNIKSTSSVVTYSTSAITDQESVQEPKNITSSFKFIKPKKTTLPIYKKTSIEQSTIDIENAEYYLVAENTQLNAKAYMVSAPFMGPSGPWPGAINNFFVEDDSGQYLILDKNNIETWNYDAIVSQINSDIRIVSKYDGLPSFPIEFTSNNLKFQSLGTIVNFDTTSPRVGDKSVTKKDKNIDDFSFFKKYTTLSNYDPDSMKSTEVPGYFSRRTYLLQELINYGVYYIPEIHFMSDNRIPMVNWIDDRSTEDVYSSDSDVCGGFYAGYNVAVINDEGQKDLVYVGNTKKGEKLYQIDDVESPILKALYNDYKVGREGNVLSMAEFSKTPNHFLYKDALGDFIVFQNEKYKRLAECGKPVVYLYPTEVTDVKVKVGAKVKISDPAYEDGWDVTAYPSGKLLVSGKEYDSLFWEGKGDGLYPYTKDYGFVVKRDNLEKTLWTHLAKLGLNEKESSDFMEFWLPKMPNTPYVRLTWLGTSEMNSLAPLTVEPKPDTVIRIFLDFEGLDSAKILFAQKLSSLERRGFTLVEWGGLLR